MLTLDLRLMKAGRTRSRSSGGISCRPSAVHAHFYFRHQQLAFCAWVQQGALRLQVWKKVMRNRDSQFCESLCKNMYKRPFASIGAGVMSLVGGVSDSVNVEWIDEAMRQNPCRPFGSYCHLLEMQGSQRAPSL